MAKSHSNSSSFGAVPKLHLMRVPKAGSTSLSIIARRLAGCNPPGPCCKWPGDPVGSCPAKGLYACQTEGRVIGCTHHYPNYNALMDANMISISIMREPNSRSISAFFYPGIHHNSKCTSSQHLCFQEYASNLKWQNIAVKMMTGAYSYEPVVTCQHSSDCNNSLDLAIQNLNLLDFMGVAEMWELSMLLLVRQVPQLEPLQSDFYLGEARPLSNKTTDSNSGSSPKSGKITANNKGAQLSRNNLDRSYSEFKATAQTRYGQELSQQNSLDSMLYLAVLHKMCRDLHHHALWQFPLVRDYWHAKVPLNVSCT